MSTKRKQTDQSVKKTKKRRSSSTSSKSLSIELSSEIIIDALTSIFGSDYRIEQIDSMIFSIHLGDLRCIEFSIHLKKPPEIQIDYLDNCKSDESDSKKGTGTHTIHQIIEFAKTMRKMPGFKDTQLFIKTDASRLKFRVEENELTLPLHALFVLTRGQSWYNSLGFFETGYEENRELAERYINSPIPTMRPAITISEKIKCKAGTLIKDCYKSIIDRVKILSQKSELTADDEAELKYYKTILGKQEKALVKLFTIDRYKLTYLYYRF